jgi:hypothetical protein
MKSPDPAKGSAGPPQQPEDRIKRAGKEMASDMKREVNDQARSTIESGKAQAAGAVERTSAALDETAANLAAEGQESLAQVAGMVAGQLSSLAHALESRSLDELAGEARSLAQRNPGLFLAGGVALGIALSRFFKASADHDTAYGGGSYGGGPGYRQSGRYGAAGGYGGMSGGSGMSSGQSAETGAASTWSGGEGPYGTEAAVPPEARATGQQTGGSSSTRGGTPGTSGTRNPMGGGND